MDLSVGQKGKVSLGATHHYLPLIYDDRKTIKGQPLAGTVHAQPGIRLINGAMRQADEVPPILSKKLIANKIERRSHVATAIDIGVKMALVIDQEPIYPIFLADEPKFLYRAWPHLLCPSDHPAAPSALPLHEPLIAEKQGPAHDQPYKVESEKEEREIDSKGHLRDATGDPSRSRRESV